MLAAAGAVAVAALMPLPALPAAASAGLATGRSVRARRARIPHGLRRLLRLVHEAAAPACDAPKLLGVLLQALGAAALVDHLLGALGELLQIHVVSRRRV